MKKVFVFLEFVSVGNEYSNYRKFLGKVCHTIFSGEFGEIRANYFSHPQKCACSYTYVSNRAHYQMFLGI